MTLENGCQLPLSKTYFARAGALVKWLWETTHVREAMGLNPGAVYWMDMTYFHIDLL